MYFFLCLKEKSTKKEANQRAVGSLGASVRKDRKLFAKAHALRGTFCSAQGCCAAYGSFEELDLMGILRFACQCLLGMAIPPRACFIPSELAQQFRFLCVNRILLQKPIGG